MKGELRSLRGIILRRLALISVIGVGLVCIVLSYLLYQRDKVSIYNQARGEAELIRTGLLSVMMATGDPEAVRGTVDNFKKQVKFDFRMVRGEHIRKQFGMRDGEEPHDGMERAVLQGALPEYAELDGASFRLVFPFKADERCGRCHVGLDGNPVAAGTVLGMSEMTFNVAEWRDASIRLTTHVVTGMLLIILALGGALYWLFAKEVMEPVHDIANTIARMEEDGAVSALAPATSREIAILNRQVEQMFKSLEDARHAHESALEEERRKMAQIRSFALEQADALGITDATEVDLIIKRLSYAVQEVEKNDMLKQVADFVTLEKKEMVLGNDRRLIRPTALYLTNLIANSQGSLKKGSMELALEEAITNAIVHGNLEVSSKLKEDDFDLFERAVGERMALPPFSERGVKISYDYDRQSATFRIEDEGPGFDWSHFLKKEVDPELLPHGRGIIIIRTFASAVAYNEAGNVLTLTFDLGA
ncbi:MAG: ATP-binding protein [Nitrospinae bacterium]|nr:ATP-binding protein [Nitrospinota bacterium]